MSEFYEIIRISDMKEREIEAFYIDPDLMEFDKLRFVLKKGTISQKISFIQNFRFYINDYESINGFFEILKEKMLILDGDIQIEIVKALTILFQYYTNEIKKIKKEYIQFLLELLIQLITEDEKNKKNEIYISLFNQIVIYYKETKLKITDDFVTYVVGLASFGKSNLSRMYSVIFTIGFITIIDSYNIELIERFFRSATDLERCVRIAIASGFFQILLYINQNISQIKKTLRLVSFINFIYRLKNIFPHLRILR